MSNQTKQTKSDLSHLIPPADFADTYINRYFDGFEDLDLLEYAHQAQKNVLLFGPTGPGKTSMLFAYAAKHQIPVATIQCNGGADIHAVFGGQVMDEDRRITYVEADPITVVREGGILYFDELNFLPPRHTANFHGLFDFRRTLVLQDKQNEKVVASPNLLVCASYNPGYEGTRPLNEALANRFHLKMLCDYDTDIEKKLLARFNVESDTLISMATKIRAEYGRSYTTPVSTNMLIEFVEQAIDMSIQFAIMNFCNAFGEDERRAVRELFSVYQTEIESDLAKATS